MSTDTQPGQMSTPPNYASGAILGYALRAPVVLYIAALAGIRLLGDWFIPDVLGILRSVLVFILIMASWKVAYEILVATSRGRTNSPDVRVGEVNDWIFFRQCLMWAMMFGVSALIYDKLGTVPGLIAGAAACFFLPAATITLAMEQSVSLALNPATWIRLIRRVGLTSYVGLTLVLAVFTVITSFVTPWLAQVLPGWLAKGPVYLVGLYCLFTMFHAMGCFIFGHRQALGLNVESELIRVAEAEQVEADPVVTAANDLASAGDVEGAIDLLSAELAKRGGAVDLHYALRDLLLQKGETRPLLEHGAFFVAVLMDQDVTKAAVLAGDYLTQHEGFRLRKPTQTVELAHAAYDKGLRRIAWLLTGPFLEDYADHSRIEDMLWLFARLEWEEKMNFQGALETLEDLLTRFPNGPYTQEARLLQAEIKAHQS